MDSKLNTAIICLGGNTCDAGARMDAALEFLEASGTVKSSSGQYRTAPEYAGESEPYLNEVVVFVTPLDYADFLSGIKTYERGVRAQNAVCALVNLDIDIVYWNGAVVRLKDSVAAYFMTGLSKLEADCL